MNEPIETEFIYNFTNYHVVINFRPRMHNINYRYDDETLTFKINAPLYTSKKKIFKYLEEFAPKLIMRGQKRNKHQAITNTHVYVFGRVMPYIYANKNRIFIDHLEIVNKMGLKKLLKDLLNDYINDMLKKYEELMKIKHYRFTIRDMHSRFGSNRRHSGALSFALSLVHYSGPIIDSVIIHELAHDIHFDHSKAFYQTVYQYCPNYKALSKALNSKDFSYGLN